MPIYFDSLTDITASDIILDISLYIMLVVLPMDSIHDLPHALMAPCRIIIVNSHDLTLDCFNLRNIGLVFEMD